MIENRHTVTATLNPQHHTVGDGAPWAGRDLSAKEVEVKGKRILIVEDEAPLRACLRMMLELEGYQVIEASNGAEGLNLFTLGEFDLVITDFEMPIMQGNNLAVRIKLLAPALPILMITGSARAGRDGRNPVDALLSKPFTVSDLRRVLGHLFSSRPEPAQPTAIPALENPSVTLAPEGEIVASFQA